jgi:lipopolysaccharide assembly outer membrane protein LptD (OstA)
VRGAVLLLVLTLPAMAAGQVLQAPSADQGRLHADHVRYDARAGVYVAEGNVELSLGDVEFRAQRIRLEKRTQTLYAFGDVRITQGNVTLTALTVTYNLNSRIARALGGPVLVQGFTTVHAGRMEFDLEKKRTSARDGVIVTHKDVTVNTPELLYDGGTGEASAEEVVVSQPGRIVRARRLRYMLGTGRLELDGNVVVDQESGERLVEEGLIQAPGDDEGRRLLASRAMMTCDRLVILTEERTVQAEGGVSVTQETRSASATTAVYSDRDRHLTMMGNVVLQDKDGSRLRADLVVISLADETVAATGNVVTEFNANLGR